MNYTKQLQDIVTKYIAAGQPWPAEKRTIGAWAYHSGLWKAHPSKLIDLCADEIAGAMREEYFTDRQGRRVRAKHAARVTDREGKQTTIWGDRTLGREFMAVSFQNRRNHILGECHQLKTDVDSFNENDNTGEQIPMVFDFTLDLEELDGGNSKQSAA